MNLYQRLMIGVLFILLCGISLTAGHGIGLIALFVLPLLAIGGAIIIKTLIEIFYHSQRRDF